MGQLPEFELIARHLRPLADKNAALNLADDAALMDGPDHTQWVIAKDAIVEDVHFRRNDPASTIAAKLLGTNLSDLAAMGAEPVHYLTVIARRPDLGDPWLASFCEGLAETQSLYGLTLLGGDTVSTVGPLLLSCTIIGRVPKGSAIQRTGAAVGDLLFVSGTLGDAALGLRVLNGLAATDDERIYLSRRYQVPEPRVALGVALRGLATACIDVSDGLAADVEHLAGCSGLGATIHLPALPLSAVGKRLPGAAMAALTGGDDYELAFTAPLGAKEQIMAAADRLGVRVTEIGVMTAGAGVTVLEIDGQVIQVDQAGWQHH